MNTLYLLQFACCIVTTLLAIILIVSRFQVRWPNRHYEVSRWLVSFAMLILSAHYVLQMQYGFRAMSDIVGAVVNILFYTPVALLICYGTFNVICFREGRRKFKLVSVLSYLVILAVFLGGYLVKGSLDIGGLVYGLLALFTLTMVYCVGTTVREIRHHRKIIEEESGEDLLPYDRYTWMAFLTMGLSVLVLVGGIVYRPFLFFIGPLMLLSLILFTITFIGYGLNLMPMEQLLEESSDVSVEPSGASVESSDTLLESSGASSMNESFAVPREDYGLGAADLHANPKLRAIADHLTKWCEEGGFRDSSVNMPLLAQKLKVSRSDLSLFFDQCVTDNFRAWLSELRYQAARKMLLENPKFNNDTISAECGFSSHAHLYKIFKAKTGMTPGQWKEQVFHS